MQRKALFVALLAAVTMNAAHAQWKWRDAKGNLQYSDMPPPAGTPDKDILQRPTAPARLIIVAPPGQAATAASKPTEPSDKPDRAEQDAAARKKQEQDQQAAKQKDAERRAAEQRRDNCARAQANMRDLQSGIRLTRTNEQGERIYLNDAQRQAEVERTRQLITSECR
ncbi:MAG: DUF4124 domain-containing protein [Roseateles depolymerans]|uniref:DUF4124 domain-containing protein n=1 Tax=Roseateles depolymerans TaxID=76731 RepID=A0A2W5E1G4_9BURK|nr:MAG: DUF4124 domain-containing protein [Roseateles depolymerans]